MFYVGFMNNDLRLVKQASIIRIISERTTFLSPNNFHYT